MSLLDVFQSIPDIVFNVFESLIVPGTLVMKSDETGWSDSPTPEEYSVDVIVTSWRKIDVEKTSFYNLIQVTDSIGLVKASQVTVPVDTADKLQIVDRFGRTIDYNIVAFDSYQDVMYAFLLRTA